MKIVIHCEAQKLRNGNQNPKNPGNVWWKKLIGLLQNEGHEIVQVGVPSDTHFVDDFRTIPIKELKLLLQECNVWISVDSFLQHLGWRLGVKGVVIFAQTNPNIFGHKENINLYVDEKYFMKNQFQTHEECAYIQEAFVTPEEVVKSVYDVYK